MTGALNSYNAVTWLLDRNVDEGRGDKLAFTDTVSDLTYGALQTETRRLANLLRRLYGLTDIITSRHLENCAKLR